MIEVELPDGTIAEFPDDTSDEVIKGALARQFAPTQQGSTWGDTAVDVGKSLASGIGRGVTGLAGLPGTLGDMANNGLSYLTGLPQLPQSPLSGETLTNAADAVTGGGMSYQPQTTAGEYAKTTGEFIPGAAAFGGISAANIGRFGILPGMASEAAGQATEGSNVEPYARVAAALLAPAAPALGARAISPFGGSITPERQGLIDALKAEGITPTAGQATGSKSLRYMESELGGGAARNIADDQARAFTEAAMSRAGQQGIASPQNMTAMHDRIGSGFNEISARNSIVADMKLAEDIATVTTKYGRRLPTAQKEIVKNMADDVVQIAKNNGGVIPGDIYQDTRSLFSSMAQGARNSDPQYAEAMRGLRNALDDAMNRSISPEDAGQWATLRRQYGNKKTLEKAAAGAGENAAEGFISPAKLRQAATTGRQGQYGRTEGDFDELSRAGQILSQLPDSGTAGRTAARNLGSPLLAGGGALAGGIPGMIAGIAAPAIAGRTLMTRPVQAYLANQAVPAMNVVDQRMQAVIAALLANGQRE